MVILITYICHTLSSQPLVTHSCHRHLSNALSYDIDITYILMSLEDFPNEGLIILIFFIKDRIVGDCTLTLGPSFLSRFSSHGQFICLTVAFSI